MIWGKADKDLLRRIVAREDKPRSADIAAIFGVSKNAIIGVCRRNKIKLPIPPYRGTGERKRKPKGASKARLRKRPKLKAVPFKPLPDPVVPLHLSIFDLKNGLCKFPYGTGPYTFCGQACHGESSYCLGHHLICTDQATDYERRQRRKASRFSLFRAA